MHTQHSEENFTLKEVEKKLNALAESCAVVGLINFILTCTDYLGVYDEIPLY